MQDISETMTCTSYMLNRRAYLLRGIVHDYSSAIYPAIIIHSVRACMFYLNFYTSCIQNYQTRYCVSIKVHNLETQYYRIK